jgi:UDP-N-acetylmuramate dehydrogenase
VSVVHEVTHAALTPYTTLRLGGSADRLITVNDLDETIQTVRDADARAEQVLVLAGGSNVVVSDEGFPGTVVLLRSTGITVAPDAGGEAVTLHVEAGHPWDEVAAFTVAEGLAGLECLAGIPGSAGATPIQNVGAYGQEVADTITSIRVYDRAAAEVRELPAAECGFGYRTSRFKHRDDHVVLGVTFRLRRSVQSTPVAYAELARTLGISVGDRAPLTEVRAAVLALRAGKGMVLDPADPDTYSVGSFFTNPVLAAGEYAALRARALGLIGTEPSAWLGGDGSVKVSAAWLIERAGFTKGYGGAGGVGISTKHTLALTNRGTGSTAALLDLAREIRDGVRKAFEVELHPEPVLVGCRL